MKSRALAFLLCPFLFQTTAGQAPSEIEVVLRPGQSLDIEPSFFRATGPVAGNAAGDVLFLAVYCRQSPEVAPCDRETGLFLIDDQGLRHLSDDELRLEDGPITLALTDSGRILVARPEGILRWEEEGFRWLVRRGDRAPAVSFQGTDVFFDQFRVSERFARENGGVVFAATLSDQSNGVFAGDGETTQRILSEGESVGGSEPLPAGALRSAPKTAGPFAAFVSGPLGDADQLLLSDGAVLRTVVRKGQTLDGLTIEGVEGFDLNSDGQVAFAATGRTASQGFERRLFLHRDGGTFAITPPLPFGGLVDLPIAGFTGPVVTDFGEVFFGVIQASGTGGIFCWRSGRLSKIVADGDVGPGGRTLMVSIEEGINIPEPPVVPLPEHRFARPRTPATLAFQARVGDYFNLTTVIWRAGSLEVLDLNDRLLPGESSQVLQRTLPIHSDASGRVLVRAQLCCGLLDEAWLRTGPARLSRSFLPYRAQGDFFSGISFQTLLRASNPGPYQGLYQSTLFRDPRESGAGAPPASLRALGAGGTEETEFSGVSGTGFLQIDTLQGGPVNYHGVIRLFRHGSPAGETTLEAQTPMTDARLVVDSSVDGRVGVAVSNPGPDPVQVEWNLLDDAGRLASSGSFEMAGRGQTAQFVDELASGLPQPFLGVLQLRGRQPFLAAGLRLSGLRLSTIPVEPPPGPLRAYGFEPISEDPPQPLEDGRPRQVLLGPGDQQALVTTDGQLHLVDRGGVRVLFGPGHPLTEASYSTNPRAEVYLVEFGPPGLLFTVSPNVGRPGLFLWDGGEVRRLVRGGTTLPDGVQLAMGTYPEVIAVNDAGEIALGVNGLFFRRPDGAVTTIFRETDPLPGGGNFGALVSVDINESGVIGFATQQAVGVADATGIRVAARLGTPIDGFRAEGFERVRVTSDGRLYFTATSSEIPAIPHSFLPLPVSALFYFDGENVHTMLRSGWRIAPGSFVAVDQVAGLSPQPVSSSPIKLNRRDELLAYASLQSGSGFSGGFFLLANTTGRPRLLVGDPDADRPIRVTGGFPDFGWNDQGELLFRGGLPEFQTGLFKRSADGQLERLVLAGDRLDEADDGAPELLRFPSRIWDLSNSGTAAFDAFIHPDFRRGAYLARPSGFHQLWVPHLAVGRFGDLEFDSSLLIHNPGVQASRVEVDVFSADGVREAGFEEIELGPNQTAKLDLGVAGALAGWARLRVRDGRVGAFLRLSMPSPNGPLSELTVPAVAAVKNAVWRAEARSSAGRDTGIAVVNTGYAETEVVFERLGAGGVAVEVRRLTLAGLEYRAVLLSELFPGQDGQGGAIYRISSSNPLALFSLEQNQGRVTGVPVSAAGAGF